MPGQQRGFGIQDLAFSDSYETSERVCNAHVLLHVRRYAGFVRELGQRMRDCTHYHRDLNPSAMINKKTRLEQTSVDDS